MLVTYYILSIGESHFGIKEEEVIRIVPTNLIRPHPQPFSKREG